MSRDREADTELEPACGAGVLAWPQRRPGPSPAGMPVGRKEQPAPSVVLLELCEVHGAAGHLQHTGRSRTHMASDQTSPALCRCS